MKAAGRGVILNMGWDQAETGMEGDSGELFAVTKGAVMAFTRSLALALAPHVRVNCLAPGCDPEPGVGRERIGGVAGARDAGDAASTLGISPEDVAALARAGRSRRLRGLHHRAGVPGQRWAAVR